MRLDFRTVRSDYCPDPRLWATFIESRTPVALLENRYHLGCSDLKHLFIDLEPVLANAPAQRLQILKNYYPGCPWADWIRCGEKKD
jgi:hypothetical protein